MSAHENLGRQFDAIVGPAFSKTEIDGMRARAFNGLTKDVQRSLPESDKVDDFSMFNLEKSGESIAPTHLSSEYKDERRSMKETDAAEDDGKGLF